MIYASHGSDFTSSRQRTGVIIGIVAGVLAITVGLICLCMCAGRRRSGNDIEVQRDEQRAMNRNWYRQPTPKETTVERRARQAREARAARGGENGPALPIYQQPVPAHHTVLQSSAPERPLPALHSTSPPNPDAPPAYDSPAVWGTGR